MTFTWTVLRVASLNTADPTSCNASMAKRPGIVFDLEPVLGLIRRRLVVWSLVY